MTDVIAKVAIESVVHDAIRDMAQTISDKHGIRINAANITWMDVSSADAPNRYLCSVVQMATSTGTEISRP
jgi:hypothetical protein